MHIVGIVAEYNPFHSGHLYHLQRSRDLANAEGVICVMSGSFTQRGEPAIVDKWTRTEMALKAGADLVFELPFAFATRSAYNFARGAIQLLLRTGVVTHISFGSESGSIPPLQQVAEAISHETADYRDELKSWLDKGFPYPAARSQALIKHFSETKLAKTYDLSALLISPNNILAVEYLRVLHEENSCAIPITVPRIGSGYHEAGNVEFSSATHIRTQIFDQTPLSEILGLPTFVKEILERDFAQDLAPVSPDQMSEIMIYNLRTSADSKLAQIHDINEGLENRIKEAAFNCTGLADLIDMVKTKRYNQTRIQRTLLYTLLGFTRDKAMQFDQAGPQYLRLLGFSPQGQKILHDMKSKSSLSTISKVGNFKSASYNEGLFQEMLELDLLAADIHSLLQNGSLRGGQDYLRSPITLI